MEKKPAGPLYHLSHGQRGPVGFGSLSLPEQNAPPKRKLRANPPSFAPARRSTRSYYKRHKDLGIASRTPGRRDDDDAPDKSPACHASIAQTLSDGRGPRFCWISEAARSKDT